MTTYLYSNTINYNKYDYIIDKITFYNTQTKKDIITINSLDATTKLMNPLYQELQNQKIFINGLHIVDVKKKLKIDFSEKQAYFISIEHDTKYLNNYRIHLYLNENYYNNLIVKENGKTEEIGKGNFYYYDLVNLELKNIEIEFKNYTCVFCKEYQETQKYNCSWDATKELKEEIEKEKELLKIVTSGQHKKDNNINKTIQLLENKLKDGFNFVTWYYQKNTSSKDDIIKISNEHFNHIEKNSYRLKIESVLKKLNTELNYKTLCENDLYKILKVLNIDIESVLKNIEV